MAAVISGQGVHEVFKNESGKACCQRVPPTESKGRSHTSMVSVGVLPLPTTQKTTQINPQDLDIKTQRGHGKGGQHQNKTDSAVRMRHMPTGIEVFINGRDQHQNRKTALEILSARVHQLQLEKNQERYGKIRQEQLGSGKRSNKDRTYNFINSRVVDHRTGKKTKQVKQVMKGRFDLLK